MMVRAGGLVADSVSRAFGSDRAVRDVTLQVMPGQIHALVGLNGAGKTTLLRMLLGMLRPDQRRVLINGHDVAKAAPTCGVKWGTWSTRRSATWN
jgi:ABC-2 type transport system ATP-binding protein